MLATFLGPRPAKRPPGRFKILSRRHQDGSKPPKTPQNASKTPQDPPRRLQDASKMPPDLDFGRFLIDFWSIFDWFWIDVWCFFDGFLNCIFLLSAHFSHKNEKSTKNGPKINQKWTKNRSKIVQNRGLESSGAGLEASWAVLGDPKRLWRHLRIQFHGPKMLLSD